MAQKKVKTKKKKRKMGRPSKFSKARPLIIRGIELGLSYNNAAISAGITATTFYNWLEKGEAEKKGTFNDFLDDIKKAEAKGELALLKIIDDAANGAGTVTEIKEVLTVAQDGSTTVIKREVTTKEIKGVWQAAAWRLERRNPDRYGRKVKVDHSWEDQLLKLVTSGTATVDEIIEEFGEPARELFESASIDVIEAGNSKA